MRILILAGSPRKGGNSDTLADAFARAAREKEHDAVVFRVCDRRINGCIACERCWENGGAPCVQKDGMQELYPLLSTADMVVFAAPCYYYGLPSQLKAVIDRFYPFSKGDKVEPFADKKCGLILCGQSEDDDDYEAAVQGYEMMTDYLGWEDSGIVVAAGLAERGDAKESEWVQAARDLAMDL